MKKMSKGENAIEQKSREPEYKRPIEHRRPLDRPWTFNTGQRGPLILVYLDPINTIILIHINKH